MGAYYNEIDPFAAAWLRELIKEGHITDGDVDERDIRDVNPDELVGYKQCHFFAGIGVWAYALKQAGWPDDREVWTGSCPCQPFSTAGSRAGIADERHLWPSFYHLIGERNPETVFGEQVASKDGLAWLDLVQSDMEGAGYTFWPFDLCAAGVGAPHIRQRLYFVADSPSVRLDQRWQASGLEVQRDGPKRSGEHAEPRHSRLISGGSEGLRGPGGSMGNTNDQGSQGWRLSAECARELSTGQAGVAGFWRDADWLWCRDEKYRPVESGSFPLVNGSPNRVGRLRGYGNALVAPLAQEFIEAYLGHDR